MTKQWASSKQLVASRRPWNRILSPGDKEAGSEIQGHPELELEASLS